MISIIGGLFAGEKACIEKVDTVTPDLRLKLVIRDSLAVYTLFIEVLVVEDKRKVPLQVVFGDPITSLPKRAVGQNVAGLLFPPR